MVYEQIPNAILISGLKILSLWLHCDTKFYFGTWSVIVEKILDYHCMLKMHAFSRLSTLPDVAGQIDFLTFSYIVFIDFVLTL